MNIYNIYLIIKYIIAYLATFLLKMQPKLRQFGIRYR